MDKVVERLRLDIVVSNKEDWDHYLTDVMCSIHTIIVETRIRDCVLYNVKVRVQEKREVLKGRDC